MTYLAYYFLYSVIVYTCVYLNHIGLICLVQVVPNIFKELSLDMNSLRFMTHPLKSYHSSSLSSFELIRLVPTLFLFRPEKRLRLDWINAIILITLASSVFSPGRIWNEILLRYVVFCAPGRRDYLIIDNKAIGGLVCRHANTVTC